MAAMADSVDSAPSQRSECSGVFFDVLGAHQKNALLAGGLGGHWSDGDAGPLVVADHAYLVDDVEQGHERRSSCSEAVCDRGVDSFQPCDV